MNKISEIIRLLQKEFPGYKPKPSKADPLDTLIATMLSQNTTDKTSYIAFTNLKNNFKNWDEVLNAPLNKIKSSIKVCGLTNQKANTLKNLLRNIKKEHSKLSLNFLKNKTDDEICSMLIKSKGIGVKTISCMLAFSLGRDVFPVDTHVHRVTNRLGIANAKNPVKTFEQLNDKIPKGKKLLFHALLIRFGRKICRSAVPLCGKCRLYKLCVYPDKKKYALLSKPEPRDNNFVILEHIH